MQCVLRAGSASLLPHIGAAQTEEKCDREGCFTFLCGPYQYCIYAVTGFVAMSMATARLRRR